MLAAAEKPNILAVVRRYQNWSTGYKKFYIYHFQITKLFWPIGFELLWLFPKIEVKGERNFWNFVVDEFRFLNCWPHIWHTYASGWEQKPTSHQNLIPATRRPAPSLAHIFSFLTAVVTV